MFSPTTKCIDTHRSKCGREIVSESHNMGGIYKGLLGGSVLNCELSLAWSEANSGCYCRTPDHCLIQHQPECIQRAFHLYHDSHHLPLLRPLEVAGTCFCPQNSSKWPSL